MSKEDLEKELEDLEIVELMEDMNIDEIQK